MMVAQDITKEKEAEKVLNDSYLKEIEAKNKELEQFAFIASHDLQEPLKTIKGFANLIEMDLDNKDYNNIQDYNSRIHRASNNSVEILEELLNFSNVGRSSNLTMINLSECFNSIIDDLNAVILRKRVMIFFDQQNIKLKAYEIELKLFI